MFATSTRRAPWKIILKPAQMIAQVTTAIEIVTRIELTVMIVVLILSKPPSAAPQARGERTAAASRRATVRDAGASGAGCMTRLLDEVLGRRGYGADAAARAARRT